MSERPNILIVMTDHQRGDTVLPEHPCKTPNLNRLAGEGVTFSEAFCPSPHCCPARATFVTGLYPSQHGVWNNVCNEMALSRGLKDGVRCWSEDLKDAGYDLHWFGKWHVTVEEGPADRGWIEHGMTSCTTGDHHGRAWEHYAEKADELNAVSAGRGEGMIQRPGYGAFRLYGTNEDGNPHDNRITRGAVELLGGLANDRPWCTFVGLTGPHDPYCVPSKYLDMYRLEDIPLPPSYADEMKDKPMVVRRMREQVFGQLGEREVREGIRHFWAYCTYLDDLFGQMLEALERSGQARNTLVLYCSDHGDYCGEHGLFAKGIPCYRGAYHVPAVVRWPGQVGKPGCRADDFVSLADFGPTFLDIAGVTARRDFAGRSLLPFLRGDRPAEWREEICTQCNGVELYYTQRSVATKTHKYVFNGFDQDELYDLQQDPHELVNRAGDEACAEIKRELVRRMWRFGREVNDPAINPYITVGLAPYGPAEAFRS